MADADFGYVGGAPGKIDLYVGKEVVRRGIPMAVATDELIELIKIHDKWVDKEEEAEEEGNGTRSGRRKGEGFLYPLCSFNDKCVRYQVCGVL